MLPRRVLAAVTAVMVVASGCAVERDGVGHRLGAAVPGTPSPDAISFRDCTKQLLDNGLPVPKALTGKITVGCGSLPVPLDYARPRGRTISLTVVRIHDTDNTVVPAQSLLLNPGGPGASGVDFALGYLGEVPTEIVQHYDLIGFDPRGVGLSEPIKCIGDTAKDALIAAAPDVTTPAGFRQAKRLAVQFAQACEKRVGEALPYFTTVNTARDMDQIRQAIGSDRMNYLGFSYGTELGWVYAHLFPKRVRAFVLDGAVDPDDHDPGDGAQLAGFEQAFDQFATNCATVSPCKQLTDPRATVAAIGSAARTTPLPTGTSRRLTYGLAILGVLSALYSKSLWPTLATALLDASKGDGAGLLALADRYSQRQPDGSYTNIYDANTAISCNDVKRGPSDAVIRRTARVWAKDYPLFGRWSGSSLFGCQQWQPKRTPLPPPKAATPTTVLVLGNLHDPATPYQGAKDLARDLGNADLLTWNGEGHTSYGSGSSCVDDAVNAYLLTMTLPADDTVCPA